MSVEKELSEEDNFQEILEYIKQSFPLVLQFFSINHEKLFDYT